MKTVLTTAALTILFLSAGAFAGNDVRSTKQANVTVIMKNNPGPVLTNSKADPCALRRCWEA